MLATVWNQILSWMEIKIKAHQAKSLDEIKKIGLAHHHSRMQNLDRQIKASCVNAILLNPRESMILVPITDVAPGIRQVALDLIEYHRKGGAETHLKLIDRQLLQEEEKKRGKKMLDHNKNMMYISVEWIPNSETDIMNEEILGNSWLRKQPLEIKNDNKLATISLTSPMMLEYHPSPQPLPSAPSLSSISKDSYEIERCEVDGA